MSMIDPLEDDQVACSQTGGLYYNRNGALCRFNGCALPLCRVSPLACAGGARSRSCVISCALDPLEWYSDKVRAWDDLTSHGVCSGGARVEPLRTPRRNVIERVCAEHARLFVEPRRPLPLLPSCSTSPN